MPPAGLSVRIEPSVLVLDGGRVLAGGAPFRVMRLTGEGARAVEDWAAGARVGDSPARRALARQLIDHGVLAPQPADRAPGSDVSVVVPVRDRPAELARCLDGVRESCPDSPVVVVDDGSVDSEAVRAVAERRGAVVLRLETPHGPGGARNRGLAACTTPFVAFVDSDVVLPRGWADPLLGHFADPRVAAVAPRVCALPPFHGVIAGYESRHSALDLGPDGGVVAPGRPVAYVPSTVLVVRRGAVGEGFDESLHIGEDVDFVWRLWRAGWIVRYEPRGRVLHDHRVRLGAFMTRRRLYARSVGDLSSRHPEALPATRASAWMAVPWALALVGRRRLAVVAAGIDVVLLGRKLRGTAPRPYRLAARMIVRGLVATGGGLAHATRRGWAPFLLPLTLRRPGARRILVAAFLVPVLRDARSAGGLRAAAGDVPMRVLDEVIALIGTWEACIRERTLRPLLPTLRSAPPAPAPAPRSVQPGSPGAPGARNGRRPA